ncbi:hypothetical protein CPB83DRAFT_71076 [Crepidotus variabilis]|uniref:Uncharacterized protein n=1 Tax=Crepidotus variabilis TaxID=179855 RepID=A0A9P6E5G0_9AGAR|nr:hypothetical protein CPB83DRAFT_71076 [Crepidotus variabilis]
MKDFSSAKRNSRSQPLWKEEFVACYKSNRPFCFRFFEVFWAFGNLDTRKLGNLVAFLTVLCSFQKVFAKIDLGVEVSGFKGFSRFFG